MLFLLSGATGLAYEVIWFKRFSHVWGSSSLAMACVVASFLFGLGLGARQLGRLADRVESPLRWYGLCEAGIGLLALLIPFEIRWLVGLSASLYGPLAASAVLLSLARFGLTFLVIGPPCVLMGGTLPLLIRQFTEPSAGPNRAAARLYAVNTLGAAAGCYFTGFHLLPWIGLFWSNVAAASLNLIIAASAIGLAGRGAFVSADRREAAPARARETTGGATVGSVPGVYLASAITGAASLVLQMVWARQLALVLGGSTYAFSAMLSVILIGIGLGSLAIEPRLRRAPDPAYVPVLVISGVIITTVLGEWLLPELTYTVALLAKLRSSDFYNAALSAAASAVLELLPALGMGILFPVLVRLTRAEASTTGKAVGDVYAWNTLGTIAGAGSTSLILIPALGTQHTVTFALGLYLVALMILFPARRWTGQVSRLLVCLTLGGLILSARRVGDPRLTNSGLYLYGYTPPDQILSQSKLLYFQEGASANVMVTDDGNRMLRVNGKIDASSMNDMAMQLGLAYLPRFLLPSARNVLIIGFGSGSTSGASLLFPDTRVICCEIEPAVYAASPHFSEVNHSPQQSRSFSIVFDDGRNYLQGSNEKYDLILSEPSNPWLAGVSNLFTREFYEAASDHLAEGGILAQWIQAYSFSPPEYALVARTLMSVFPHHHLVRINDGDTILLASRSPLVPTREALAGAQTLVDSIPAVRTDVARFFGSTDVVSLLLRGVLLDEEGLRRLVERDGSPAFNTDLNLKLEFDAPRQLFRVSTADAVNRALLEASDPAWFGKAFDLWAGTTDQVGAFRALESLYFSKSFPEQARQIVDIALTKYPNQPDLLGDRLMLAPVDESTFARSLEVILASSEALANRTGVALAQARNYDRAVVVFQRLATRYPNSMMAWNNLALTYAALGQRNKATEAFRKAISLDPFNEAAERSFEAFQRQAAPAQGG